MRGRIGQRGKSFYVAIYGGIDPETGKERRHFRSFKRRELAEHYLAHMVDKRMSGQLLPSPNMTCGRFFERWLELYAQSHVAQTTLPPTRTLLGYILVPRLPEHSFRA